MNAMPILPNQIPCVCIMYYMANKADSDYRIVQLLGFCFCIFIWNGVL